MEAKEFTGIRVHLSLQQKILVVKSYYKNNENPQSALEALSKESHCFYNADNISSIETIIESFETTGSVGSQIIFLKININPPPESPSPPNVSTSESPVEYQNTVETCLEERIDPGETSPCTVNTETKLVTKRAILIPRANPGEKLILRKTTFIEEVTIRKPEVVRTVNPIRSSLQSLQPEVQRTSLVEDEQIKNPDVPCSPAPPSYRELARSLAQRIAARRRGLISRNHITKRPKQKKIKVPVENRLCDECGELLPYPSNDYDRHMLYHRPEYCPICNKSFAWQGNLRTHMKTHSDEKPFVCSICGKESRLADTHRRHMKSHGGEKNFACPDCPFKCHEASRLRLHRMTHSDEKPFKCPMCPHRTKSKSKLTMHIRTHTRETPFDCPECEESFIATKLLVRHERKMHPHLFPITCELCPATFKTKIYLRKHVKVKHPSVSEDEK